MLQDGVPVVYRKPSSRSERRLSLNRVKANGVPPPQLIKEEESGGGASNGDLRGVLEIVPAGKDRDAGVASSLLGRRQSSNKGGGETYRRLYVCACAVAFVNAMTFSVLGPFLPAYVSGRFGSTSTQVGMIMAAYPAVNLTTSPLVGWIMNRYGRWKSLFAGLLILTVATALYGLASSVTGLYVASGLHGASLSFIHVSSLGLLSAFPERLTESMAGIEIWSGVAAILGPPLGGLVVPYGGVPSIFLAVAMFPVCLVFFTPRVGDLVRAEKGERDEVGQSAGGASSLWKVARNRGVLAGAFVTAYNYGVIGFLEVTLAPHLAQTLSTSPRSIGFVLVLPNILFTVTAMKAEGIVDRHGVRRTLLGGLCIMAVSLIMCGPSPALAPALVTRGAARGVVGVGLLAFQVGSSLASVPAFTAMQGGVAGVGTGADDMVASAHAMSIGLGEIIGPMVGGYFVELLPTSRVFACEPDVPIVELDDPIFQLAGELRPHHAAAANPPDSQDAAQDSQEGAPSPPRQDVLPEALDGRGVLDGLESRQGDGGGAQEDEAAASGVGAGGENARRLLGVETQRVGEGPGLVEEREKAGVTAAAGRGGERESMTLWPLGAGFLVLAEEEGAEKGGPDARVGPLRSMLRERNTGVPVPGGRRGARDGGGEAGEEDHHHRQREPRLRRRLLERRERKARPRQARHRRQHAAAPEPVEDARIEPPAVATGDGDGDGDGAEGGAAAPRQAAFIPFVAETENKAVDLLSSLEDGEDPLAGRGGAAEGERVPAAEQTSRVGGGGEHHVGGGDGDKSCDSSFPLATTLLAWASVFAIAAMYRLLPHQHGASKGHGAGLPS